ncbi:MAG TPA: phage holin family protein [Candidatus Paceibacterota bacterium]
MKIIVKIVIVALAIMGLPRFVPGVAVAGFYYALIAALAIGAINLLIKPLISLVTLPINIFTLGLFGLLVNGGLLWLVALYVPGFSIDGYLPAFIGALAIALINWVISKF